MGADGASLRGLAKKGAAPRADRTCVANNAAANAGFLDNVIIT